MGRRTVKVYWSTESVKQNFALKAEIGAYLRERSSVDDHFKVLGHLLQEVLRAWSLHHKDVLNASLDIDRDRVVRSVHFVELAVHECLVKIKHERLAASNMLRLRPKKAMAATTSMNNVCSSL